MKYILLFIGMFLLISKAQAQGFTSTDSLRTYNIKYITNNAATAFTNLRLHTLLRGIIDWVDTARAGTGGGGAIGIDTLYALNDSTIRYRRNGVFRNTILRGVYDTRRKVDTAYALNDSTLQIKINGTNRNIILPGRHWTLQGILNNGATLTENETITLADSLTFTSGLVIIDNLNLPNLATQTDTTANKPVVIDASGNVHKMVGWPVPPSIDTTNKWINNIRRRSGTDSVEIFKNGSWQFAHIDSVGGSAAGSNTQIQYNNSGAFGAEAAFAYNATTNKLSVDSIRSLKNIPDTVHIGWLESDNLTDNAWFSGTSITQGVGASSDANSYANIVAHHLRVNEINLGAPGNVLQHSPTWPNSLTLKDTYTSVITAKGANDRYLFFAWGENDITHDYTGTYDLDTAYFKRDYVIVLNYALTQGWALSDIRIISPFYQTGVPLPDQQKYVDAARHIADSMGIQYINVFTPDKALLSDNIHPYDRGHAHAANIIISEMEQPLQVKTGETLVNAGTTVLNKTYFFGEDTSVVIPFLMGITEDGALSRIESGKYLILDGNDTAKNVGNATVTGNMSANGGVRARGYAGFTTGSGFELAYSAPHGYLVPANRDAATQGNVIIPQSKVVIGNVSPLSPFSQLWVDGATASKGFYSTGQYILYDNNLNLTTLNLLVNGDSVGHIETYGPAGYKPLSINPLGGKPAIFNSFTDNGSGAKVQIDGKLSVSSHTIASNSDSALVWNRSTNTYEYAKINSGGSASMDIGGSITGGTNGSVLFVDGGNMAQDNANLFFDNSNNRLGVGTATPAERFHVVGSIRLDNGSQNNSIINRSGFTDIVQNNSSSYNILEIVPAAASTNSYIITANDPAKIITSPGGRIFFGQDSDGTNRLTYESDNFSFFSGTHPGTERFRITSAGEVNIGNYTDQGSYTLQNTGGLYQNGAFRLQPLTAPPSTYNVLVHGLTDSIVYQLPATSLNDGNGIYGGNGSLPSNVTVTGDNNSLTFDDIFAFHVNADYGVFAKANGTGTYTESVIGAGNQYWIGYTPVAGTFGKGVGIVIDTNENVGIGTPPPTAMPLYATGSSLFVQGLQSNHGNFYKVSNITTDGAASLAAYFYTIDATAGNVTVTLPAASTAFGNTMGITYKFQRIDNSGNTVTIQRAGSDTINGGTSFTITTQYTEIKEVQCTSASTWAQW